MIDVNDPRVLEQYLRHHGMASSGSPILINPLSGGVSCSVIKINSDKGCFVLKQALARLKVKQEWVSDLDRINVEKQALRFFPSIITDTTPQIVFEDEDNFLFMMECAPEGSVPWKQLLMEGSCNPDVAKKVGNILGCLHERSNNNEVAKSVFAEKKYFVQLRVDPFFEFLKMRHPELGSAIDRHIEQCLGTETSLVTGDYSPKNILVHGDRVIPIDFEVTHFGDSSFDLGFLATHLILKSIRFPERANDYCGLLRNALSAYFAEVTFIDRKELEMRACRQLAWILLARIDGKSPSEYITETQDKQFVRRAAQSIIADGLARFEEVIDYLAASKN